MAPPRFCVLQFAALILACTASDLCFGRQAVDNLSDKLRFSPRKGINTVDKSKTHFLYKNNIELEDAMRSLAKECRNIMLLYSIGTSVLGFPLWVLEISDKPGDKEAEPDFKYVGNLHGDEPLGRELLLLLGTWLCHNYMNDPLATLIVRDVHLHLLPSMNPDGFTMRSRNNANDIDLNRDFPDQFSPQNNNEGLRQPETRAIMNWTRAHNFVASASFHGGAVVANYPWDGSSDGSNRYSQCDDDETFRYLAMVYSGSHASMRQSAEFPRGITNGAAWYPLYGGMQDWNYIHGKCMDLTLEVTENKWPPENELKDIWEANRLSMLLLVASLVKGGIHGRVTSLSTGLPLPASISVQGINFTIFATIEYGNYHRLLSPGKGYKVVASMRGYISQTAVVSVEEGKVTRLDFELQPIHHDHGGDIVVVKGNKASFDLEKKTDEKIDWNMQSPQILSYNKSRLGFRSQTFTLVKDSPSQKLDSSKFQLKSFYNGDVINEIVASHVKIASTSLTIGVLLCFMFLLYRYRALFMVKKTVRKLDFVSYQ